MKQTKLVSPVVVQVVTKAHIANLEAGDVVVNGPRMRLRVMTVARLMDVHNRQPDPLAPKTIGVVNEETQRTFTLVWFDRSAGQRMAGVYICEVGTAGWVYLTKPEIIKAVPEE